MVNAAGRSPYSIPAVPDITLSQFKRVCPPLDLRSAEQLINQSSANGPGLRSSDLVGYNSVWRKATAMYFSAFGWKRVFRHFCTHSCSRLKAQRKRLPAY